MLPHIIRFKYIYFYLILASIVNTITAQQFSYSESFKGNMFSNKIDPFKRVDISGENLFTGDVSFSIPINLLSTYPISLNYSSNVKSEINTSNSIAQSSWVGVGWELPFGTISADINNTRDPSDDTYSITSNDITTELISNGGNTFFLKNYKYWRIIRHVDGNKNILGWEIVKEDGTRYRFGNYDTSSHSFVFDYEPTNATRFFLGIGNIVSNPASTEYSALSKISYQWDLSDIEDIAGNHVQIKYQQFKRSLKVGTIESSLQFTVQSYPYTISDHSFFKIEFVLDTVNATEYTQLNSLNIQETYRSKYLDKVLLKNHQNIVLRTIELDYDVEDVVGNGNVKRYLKSVSEINEIGKVQPPIKLTYYGVNGIAQGNNMGAIKTINYKEGGFTEYSYLPKSLSEQSLSLVTVPTTGVRYHAEVDSRFGINGNNFAVVRTPNGTKWNLHVYIYSPNGWIEDFSFPLVNAVKQAWVSNDYVVVQGNDSTVAVCVRQNESWKVYPIDIETATGYDPVEQKHMFGVMGMEKKYFVVQHGSGVSTNIPANNMKRKVSVVRWDETQWTVDSISLEYINYDYQYLFDCRLTDSAHTNAPVFASCNPGFFIINQVNKVFMWNGSGWSTSTFSIPSGTNSWKSFVGNDYFVTQYFTGEAHPLVHPYFWSPKTGSIEVWKFNGTNWVVTYQITPNQEGVRIIATPDRFYEIRNYAASPWVRVYERGINNDNWTYSGLFTSDTWGEDSTGFVNIDGMSVTVVPRKDRVFLNLSNSGKVCVGSRVKTQTGWGAQETLDEREFTEGVQQSSLIINGNSVVSQIIIWGTAENTALMRNYELSDGAWQSSDLPNVTFAQTGNSVTNNVTFSGYDFLGRVIQGSNSSQIINVELWKSGIGVNNSNIYQGNPVHYPVSSKLSSDGMSNSYLTTFQYDFGVYDEGFGSAKYNKVTIFPPNSDNGSNGRKIIRYYNDLEDVDPDIISISGFQNFDGLPYNTKIYKGSSTFNEYENIIDEETNWYASHSPTDEAKDQGVFQHRAEKIDKYSNGINSSINFTYNIENGLPKTILEDVEVINSNGLPKNKLTEIEYAYESHQTDMGLSARHILTHPYEIGVYEIDGYNKQSKVLIAKSRSFYSSDSTHQLTSQKKWNGINWITTDSIITRNKNLDVVESENVDGLRTTFKWGYNNTLPIATIVNATDSETKVDICENFSSVTGGVLSESFSIFNPLSISLALSSETRGFSDNCQKVVTGYSETSPVGIYVNTGNLNSAKNYIIEFDFLVTDGTMEVYTSAGSTNLSQSTYSAVAHKKKWHHGKILWNLGGNGSNSKVYFRSHWANQETFAATYFLDNVRIYPADAVCTSQTYDPKTLQVISTTDENGITRYALTDGFGRMTTVLK